MEPVFFVMAILGCADDGGDCRQARIEPVHYTSVAACQEAVPATLRRSTDIDYPVIGAQCQPSGAQLARGRPARGAGG
jgi:hypothetical protein